MVQFIVNKSKQIQIIHGTIITQISGYKKLRILNNYKIIVYSITK